MFSYGKKMKTSCHCGSARTNTPTSAGLEAVPLDRQFNLTKYESTHLSHYSPLPETSAVGPVMPPLPCPLLVWPLPILQRKVDFVEGLQLQNVPSSKSQFAAVEGQTFIQNFWKQELTFRYNVMKHFEISCKWEMNVTENRASII